MEVESGRAAAARQCPEGGDRRRGGATLRHLPPLPHHRPLADHRLYLGQHRTGRASFPSAKVGTVRFIVVRSGSADLGKWITETRNVLEDFKKIYGEAPGEPAGAITLSINSQNTGSRAESFFGEILFKKP